MPQPYKSNTLKVFSLDTQPNSGWSMEEGLRALKEMGAPQDGQQSQLVWTIRVSETEEPTYTAGPRPPWTHVADVQFSLHEGPTPVGAEVIPKASVCGRRCSSCCAVLSGPTVRGMHLALHWLDVSGCGYIYGGLHPLRGQGEGEEEWLLERVARRGSERYVKGINKTKMKKKF